MLLWLSLPLGVVTPSEVAVKPVSLENFIISVGDVEHVGVDFHSVKVSASLSPLFPYWERRAESKDATVSIPYDIYKYKR